LNPLHHPIRQDTFTRQRLSGNEKQFLAAALKVRQMAIKPFASEIGAGSSDIPRHSQ